MPKRAIKSYEDWTPPKFLQGEDDEIDMERVKLEFYTRESENAQYRQSNRQLKSQVADLRSQVNGDDDDDDGDESDDTPDVSKQKSKNEGKGQGPSLNEIRLKIALEKGLTINQAKRLVGSTEEELEADAVAYMEEHGITQRSDKDGDEGDDAPPSNQPPRRQPRRSDVKSGSERGAGDGEPSVYDPDKFLDQV